MILFSHPCRGETGNGFLLINLSLSQLPIFISQIHCQLHFSKKHRRVFCSLLLSAPKDQTSLQQFDLIMSLRTISNPKTASASKYYITLQKTIFNLVHTACFCCHSVCGVFPAHLFQLSYPLNCLHCSRNAIRFTEFHKICRPVTQVC